jgi:predicted permease
MFSDIKFALRQLAKSPGFAAVATLTLGLGIGVNLTMFGFVRGMVLQALIRDRSQRLVSIYSAGRSANRDFRFFSYPEFEAIRGTTGVFSETAAVGYATCILGRPEELQRGIVGLVSDHYFSLIRAQPLMGRFFSPEELRPNAGVPVVVVGYGLWQRLGGLADIIGSRIQISGQPYAVIGVLPPSGANVGIVGPEAWLPLGIVRRIWGDGEAGTNPLDARTYEFNVIASFQPGVTQDNAPSRLGGLNRLLNAPPLGDPSAPRELVLGPPPRFTFHNEGPQNESFLVPFAVIATALALTVLLVASLNLANMLLARGLARRKEIAIRLSLGATRFRIIRQLMAESLVLASLGGAFGFLLSRASGVYLKRLAAEDFAASRFDVGVRQSGDIGDLAVIAFLVVGSAMVFGLAPALRSTRVDLVEDLKSMPGQPAEGGRWNRFFSPRHCRMMGQIALSFMLLFCAGLFVRGARNAIDRDPGFSRLGEWVVNLDYIDPKLHSGVIARREQALVDHAAVIPGVSGAAVAGAVPFDFDSDNRQIFAAGSAAAALNSKGALAEPAPWSVLTTVSRGYFSTVGVPLLKGRDFSEAESRHDSGHHVAIIDESLARALFGTQEAIGRRVALSAGEATGPSADRQMEVVGIVRSAHEDVFETAAPHRIYVPLGPWTARNIYLHVKIANPENASVILEQLRKELIALDPDTPVLRTRLLGDFLDKNPNLLLVRLAGITFGGAGIVALFLAVIGVYGVKAHAVARRTREIGIRIALGARPSEVMALILRQGLQQTAVGLAIGLLLAFVAGHVAAKMLYQVSPFDPPTLAAAALLLGGTVLLACFLPARRATRVDPAVTLRSE